MAQSDITIQMDEELVREFEKICDKMGLTMNEVLVAFIKKVIAEQKLPFEITAK